MVFLKALCEVTPDQIVFTWVLVMMIPGHIPHVQKRIVTSTLWFHQHKVLLVHQHSRYTFHQCLRVTQGPRYFVCLDDWDPVQANGGDPVPANGGVIPHIGVTLLLTLKNEHKMETFPSLLYHKFKKLRFWIYIDF